MSKKKFFSGSTMTLKDFHGGSIPSDLQLPSAPGVGVRHSDRATVWGNPSGRSDYRSRPGSSGASHTFDEKASFLSHPQHIGRNFDEDERKPLDGIAAPRRTISDDAISTNIWASNSRPDPKPDAGKFSSWQTSGAPVAKPSAVTASVANAVVPNVASHTPNVWAARKEVAAVSQPAPPTWSGPMPASKLVQASALENIQSGRWQSKSSLYNQSDVEVIRHSESESESRFKETSNAHQRIYGRGGIDMMNDARVRYGTGKELNYDTARSPLYNANEGRSLSAEGKQGVAFQSQTQLHGPVEVSERPKLKLLPRTKPLESPELHIPDDKQTEVESGHVELINEVHGNSNAQKSVFPTTEGINHSAERPKLNLKPRSHPLEQPSENRDRDRGTLFGGARPRELVLKERGVDDVVLSNVDVGRPLLNRGKTEVPKPETKLEAAAPSARYTERPERSPTDQHNARDVERKELRPEPEKANMQRNLWRNEKRNEREAEKQHEHRRPEPETWRKPMEPAMPAPLDASGHRYGRMASALELAQAFSSSVSVSDTRAAVISQKKPVAFSRLTESSRELYPGPTPRHINGY